MILLGSIALVEFLQTRNDFMSAATLSLVRNYFMSAAALSLAILTLVMSDPA